MTDKLIKPKPIYFSDHFKVDKAKLKELGVFDPILNFDTKLFVDPLYLKTSANPTIQESRNKYAEYFANVLKLLSLSKQEDDKCRLTAKKLVCFPEYKFTCIGYGSDSIDGSGSGAELNDKIFKSALEIVDVAKNDPDIFLLLPLLEEGIGADRISDMTQNIIDDEICAYTVEMMVKLNLNGDRMHKSRSYTPYNLLLNPFSKCPIKLVPNDILAALPLADTFEQWLVDQAENNSILRDKINNDIGRAWFESTKKMKKESLLMKIKTDKEFFMEVLNSLKEARFEHYDVEEDANGLHRWLKDSAQFIGPISSASVKPSSDTLESITQVVHEIILQFKHAVENKGLKQLFWTQKGSDYKQVKEFYSQMLFYMVSDTWLMSQDSNVTVEREFNAKVKQLDFKFTISERRAVRVQVKHSNNYRGLESSFDKQLAYCEGDPTTKGFCVVMNLDSTDSDQLKSIKQKSKATCEVIDIGTLHEDANKPAHNCKSDFSEFDFPTIEFEGVDLSTHETYLKEKQKGGKLRHEHTTLIKERIIKPMFLNREHIKGKSVKQRAEKLSNELSTLSVMTAEERDTFLDKFELSPNDIKSATPYFSEDKSEQIYRWCLAFSKE